MNLLIDSHEFIWWADSPQKLSSQALSTLLDKSNNSFSQFGKRLGNANKSANQ